MTDDTVEFIPCRLCGGKAQAHFVAMVLKKYQVKFYLCDDCDSMQTEEPFWLSEAYSDGRRSLDTGAVHRASFLQMSIFFSPGFLILKQVIKFWIGELEMAYWSEC